MDIELRKRKEIKQETIESSWECDQCGKSTFSTDYDYLVHPRLHLGCALEAENQGHSIKDQYLEACEDVPDKDEGVTWQFNQDEIKD
jgi:hypothetical protein